MKKVPLCIGLLLSAFLALGQPGWNPGSMIKLRRVGGTDMSPDGRLVAYTISNPLMDGEKSEFLTQIWVASADGKMNIQYTQGDKSCTNPRFSPDGQYLAFISGRKNDGKSQIWLIRLAGGEAEQLTHSKTGIDQFNWSPDSRRIAFLQRDGDTEQEEKDKKEKRDWTLVDSWKYGHLYTIGVEKNAHGDRQVRRLTSGNFHITSFDWSPDGKVIAFTHQITPSLDLWTTSDISLVPSDSGRVKSLVAMGGMDASPMFSPDGKSVAFVSDGGVAKWAGTSDIYVVSTSGGLPRKLAETPDRQASLFKWSPDGTEIYFGENSKTCYRLFAEPINGGQSRVITSANGNHSNFSFSANGRSVAFIYQNPETAPDVFVSGLSDLAPVRISDVNPELPKLPMGKTEVIRWKSKDGKEIEGLLTYPVGYQSGKKCPLILNIHGGPAGVFTAA